MATAIDQQTGLPEGFVLDVPPSSPLQPSNGGLPEGFVLDAPPTGELAEQEAGLIGRIGEDLSGRIESSLESVGRDRGLLNNLLARGSGLTQFQVAGDVAGAGLDVIGEVGSATIGKVGELAQKIAPETSATVSDFVSAKAEEFTDFAADKLNALAQTEIGQLGIEAAQDTAEAWQEFSDEHPTVAADIADTVGAAGNIALVLAPVKGAPKGAIGPKQTGLLGRAAGALDDSIIAKQKSFVDDLVRPLSTKKVRESQIKRSVEGGGLFGGRTVTPSSFEAEIAGTVGKVAGVKPSNTLLQNLNAVQSGLTNEAENLTTLLKGSNVKIPRPNTKRTMETVLAKLKSDSLLVGDAAKTGEKVFDKARKLLLSNPNTPAGVLKSRKQLDAWVKKQSTRAFDPKTENALSVSLGEIRQSMNDIISNSVPNIAVKESLKKQTNLFRAIDNIAPKAAKEAQTAIGRMAASISKELGITNILDPKMTLALSALGLGAIASPTSAAVAGAGVLAVKGAKSAVTSKASKQAVSRLLRATDKAIAKATARGSVDLAKKLRADRALVIEFVKSKEDERK